MGHVRSYIGFIGGYMGTDGVIVVLPFLRFP